MINRRNFLSLLGITLLGVGISMPLSACSELEKMKRQESGGGSSSEFSNNSQAIDCQAYEEPQRLSLFLFNTYIEIQAYCTEELMKMIEDRLLFFENTFSKTVVGSDIYNINHAAGAPMHVQPETIDIISKAEHYSVLSEGLFDISIGGVVELWDFDNEVIPEADLLAEALLHVDYRTIIIDEDTVALMDPETQLDLGAIAKGYIVDDIVGFLESGGCKHALINLGGNAYAHGTRFDGSSWKLGIQDPDEQRGTILAAIAAQDSSLVTSGRYERSFELDGQIYHHILDPRTGMPITNDMASASILSRKSIDGDALSTITFLLGTEHSMDLLEEKPNIEALFIKTDKSMRTTSQVDLELM